MTSARPMIALLIVLLSSATLAQGLKTKPRVLAPVKVEVVAASSDENDSELARLLANTLRTRGDIALVSSRNSDYAAYVTAERLNDVNCAGFVSAMLLVDADGKRRLSVHTAADIQALAQHLAAKLNDIVISRAR